MRDLSVPQWAPPEPTPEQCSGRERVTLDGSEWADRRAHALWWPQMGGYVGKAVIVIGDCSELWLWHDGDFPIADGPPRQIHLDSYQSWVDTFQWLIEQYDDEYNGGPQPYVWDLPEGVTVEEAHEVYQKMVAWGLWTPDPGGFEVRPYDKMRDIRVCAPVACPPFTETVLEGVRPDRLLTAIDEAAGADTQGTTAHRAVLRWVEMYGEAYGLPSADALQKLAWPPFYPAFAFELPPGALDEVQEKLLREAAAHPRYIQQLPEPNTEYNGPLIVGVPAGLDNTDVLTAIQLCQRLGLVADNPHGVLLVPEEVEEET